MTRRTLFAALLAPFAPKLKLPSLTCVGPFRFHGIPIVARPWMPKNEIVFVDFAMWRDAARQAQQAMSQLRIEARCTDDKSMTAEQSRAIRAIPRRFAEGPNHPSGHTVLVPWIKNPERYVS